MVSDILNLDFSTADSNDVTFAIDY